jgi:uncharacterized membrane protein
MWVYSASGGEKPCRDSMSGAYFSFNAQVDLGSHRLGGCAARGS